MKPDSKLFDDLAKMAGGAINLIASVSGQIREEVELRVEEMATRLDLVPREDLDRVETMLTKLRKDHNALQAQVEKLTKTKSVNTKKDVKKTAKKAVKKTTTKPKPKTKVKAKPKAKKKK